MQDPQALLEQITILSHDFGTMDYVRGGGGNTSVKNDATLWVKPSGTTLAGLEPQSFVALDRSRLADLYRIEPPDDASQREALVKGVMEKAVYPDSSGRASVEAPLHDSLMARFVVHTHPALVNGMTCARQGAQAAARLFPQALWLDYIDPGYTLCMEVRKQVDIYEKRHGRQPAVIFLKNHGVFVAADTPDEIRRLYRDMIDKLTRHYRDAGVSTTLAVAPPPSPGALAETQRQIRQAFQEDALAVASSGSFPVARGPVSPDHIVYAKSYPYADELAPDGIRQYEQQYGYKPVIVVRPDGVHTVGPSDKKAALALELAQDGALVVQLAAAFGGVEYMTDRARLFIENWEVESYRSQQIQ